MNRFKDYLHDFIKDESGMEIMQTAVIIVISAILAGVVFALGTAIKGYVEEAQDIVDQEFNNILNPTGGGSGGTTPP